MFEVKCKIEHNNLYLSVTHNGYQWTSIDIKNPEVEIPQVIDVLQHHLSDQFSRPDSAWCICSFCGDVHPYKGKETDCAKSGG